MYASFMYSWSYCPDQDVCMGDSWNYLGKYCRGGWIEGYSLDVTANCQAVPVIGKCVNFVSSKGAPAEEF